MKKILVATNLGRTSRFALKRALLLARARDAALHVLQVADQADAGNDTPLDRHIEEAVEWLQEELPDAFGAGFTPASAKKTTGSPAEAIAAEAEAIGADLLVAGLTEKPVGERILEGTILERLLLLSSLPLLVVRTEPKGSYERVLVGLDLGPTSPLVLQTALKIAPAADFTIVHANEGSPGGDAVRDRINAVARQCFAAARKDVSFLEGAIEIRIDDGTVGEVMNHHAGRVKPELVAFGKHTKGMAAAPYLGRGARAILEGLEVDMLVTLSSEA